MSINVTHLRSFWHVARAESFSAAARELGVSQPTLTRQVQALEADYGLPLFLRTSRRVRLTQEGYQLVEMCGPIFEGLANVEDFLKTQSARSVRVHSVQHTKISEFLIAAYRTLPRLRFDVEIMRSTQVLDSLMRRDCDFGLLTLEEAPPELAWFRISTAAMIAFVREGHPWRSRDSISIRELEGERVVIASRSGQSRRVLDENLARYGVTVSVVQVVDSNEVVWDLVRRGAGVGVIGYTGLVDRLLDHRLAFEETSLSIDVHFACRRERLRTDAHRHLFEVARRGLVDP